MTFEAVVDQAMAMLQRRNGSAKAAGKRMVLPAPSFLCSLPDYGVRSSRTQIAEDGYASN